MIKNYDYFLQENNYDCGIASLLTVFTNIGIKVSKEKILDYINFDKQGISAFELVKIGKKFGCNSYGIKGEIEKIDKKLLPCIAHIIDENNFFHYVVILEIKNDKNIIKIMDPASGILDLSFEEFNKKTTNIFLIFENTNETKSKDKRFKKIIYNIFKENKKMILTSFVLSFILVFLSLLFSYYLKTIMTNIEQIETIKYIFVFFITVGIIKNLFDYIKNNIITNINVSLDKNITKKVINHIMYLPYNYFVKKTTGELVNIMSDVENFKDIIIKIFVLCTVDLFLLSLVIIYISFLNIYYLIAFLILILFFFLITKKFQYLFNDSFKKLKKSRIKYSSKIIDYFSSFDTFKNLTIEKKLEKNINQTYQDISLNNKEYLKKINCYNFLNNLLIDKFYLIIIFIASLLTISGKFQLYDIVLLSSIIYMIFGLFSNIFESISMYKIYETSVIRVLDVLDIEKEKVQKQTIEKIDKIEYKNIKFNINDKEIIKNLNLIIKAKENLFITGESGVGKSTIFKLLLGYYNLAGGNILINNKNIELLNINNIRNLITYVSQNEKLFTNSIYNNLSLICDEKEKIIKALNTVEFNYSNFGLDYLVEENGINLSGGERKKLILARALLKSKQIIILDECFNEIDNNIERKIIKNIKKDYPYLTICLISHRDNNKDLFSKTFLLERGRIDGKNK